MKFLRGKKLDDWQNCVAFTIAAHIKDYDETHRKMLDMNICVCPICRLYPDQDPHQKERF